MGTEKEKILEVENLSVLIKERFLVKDASFSMLKGDCLGIIGEESSGKTSLIKAITGSLPISDGKVYVCGQDIQEHPAILLKTGISLDPPVFFKFQTVMQNMEYLCSLSGHFNRKKVIDVLNKFHLADKMKKKVLFMSYYEKKLMALALAFINEPALLILDEPFKSLPVANVQQIKHYVQELRENGTSLIITSKNYDSIEDMCDNYMFMAERRITQILPRKECEKYSTAKTFAFVAVKYPHYCGKLVKNEFNLDVKLFGKKVLFEADEDTTADVVKFLTKSKLAVYSAGYLNRKSEKILANLTPYFKEDRD